MIRRFVAAATALPLGCAARAADFNDLSSGLAGLVGATCTKITGLRQDETYFAECQDSPARSLEQHEAAYRPAVGGQTCRRQRLADGSAPMATCMLDSSAAEPVAFSAEATETGKNYYNVTNAVKFRREHYSCAQMGLTPGGALFEQCVASLQGALLSDPN